MLSRWHRPTPLTTPLHNSTGDFAAGSGTKLCASAATIGSLADSGIQC